MAMVKTQVYFPASELKALHRVARAKKRRVADLVREAVRRAWLTPPPTGPIGLFDGELRGTSLEHGAEFGEP
jgi:hypothetical protein